MAELLEKSFYFDDLLTGKCNDQKAFTIYQRAKMLIAEGRFNLRKWKANSPDLQRAITESEGVAKSISAPVQKVNKQDNESHVKSNTQNDDIFMKVLGMNWNSNSDEIIFSFSELSKYASSFLFAKRLILKVRAKIYDPMGFLSPLVVEMTILFQDLCINKTNWDAELNRELLEQWKSILQDMSLIDCYRIPRYFARHPVNLRLHGFSNASERAYDMVVYVRGCVFTRTIN